MDNGSPDPENQATGESFDELGKKETASVRTLAVFDELAAEAENGLFK